MWRGMRGAMKYYFTISSMIVLGVWLSCASYVTLNKTGMRPAIISDVRAATTNHPYYIPETSPETFNAGLVGQSGIIRVVKVYKPQNGGYIGELQQCRQIMDTVASLNHESYRILTSHMPDE